MATLALAAAGAAAGSALLPAGVGFLGVTLTGATIGAQIGALAGSYVDNALFGSSGSSRAVEGPRLSDLHVTASSEGAHIPRLYGRARLGGQVIWASDLEEEIVTSTHSSGGGKGIGGGGSGAQVTEYRYYANFAVGLCEGAISRIGRVWADGRELDLSAYTWRLYTGSDTQAQDSLIAAHLGTGRAPAFRGLAYVVFERMALVEFGNRVPQLSFEVFRALEAGEEDIRGIVIIPGSGEFVYATEPVRKAFGDGVSQALNIHTREAATDWQAGIDQLEATLPNAASASLVVSWFGTDLRAGHCQIKPGVERADTATEPIAWSVAGLARADAHVVSQREGRPAYGGTPSDQTVIDAIRDLTARGFAVTLTPFVLMDIPAGNALPDPYGGSAQGVYPWRGRITCHPAAGVAGSGDKTAAAAAQIASFVGTAQVSHFALNGEAVIYSGPNEWSYRRMVLHQAFLAKAAGNVDAFLIGTELRGLTWVRSAEGVYPFVTALVQLAADVKSVLGPSVKVTYAADWSEYFGHQPTDGTGDVYFHLDPLWASSAIDAIGIDVYWPLADWRDGRTHLDYLAGYTSIYDLDYLSANVQGGEGFDWYYASAADREAQVRTPIADGQGRPWVYRYKDIKSWWSNAHYNRSAGVESATPTAWVPQSKPFWFMEIGCPAVDKGANQPNVFVDPKSSESAYPYYSRGVRDDFMQRRFLKAFIDYFDWTKPGYAANANPVSTLTGQRMVDPARIFVYCWDARPFPAFPQQTDVWGDGANWQFGHWLNGRLSNAPLGNVVAQILTDYGFDNFDADGLSGVVSGYVIDRIMPARDALQPLELAYFFDSLESGDEIAFRHRGLADPAGEVGLDDLVETRAGGDLLTLTRAQETELPASAKVRFIAAGNDYRQAVAEARRLSGASGRVSQADLAVVLDEERAGSIAETWLFETWAARERASLRLPPSALALEPGDVLRIVNDARTRDVRITEVSDDGARAVSALAVDPEVYGGTSVAPRPVKPIAPVVSGPPTVAFMDLPLLTDAQAPRAGYVAALQQPWPGGVALYSSPQTSGYALRTIIAAPTKMGRTLDVINPGPPGRIDHATRFRVRMAYGVLTSADVINVFSGANAAALETGGGQWEVIQFLSAELVAPSTYEISGLLRGQAGTESALQTSLEANARFIVLDAAISAVSLSEAELEAPLNWRFGPSSKPIGDADYATAVHAFRGAGLRPYAPVHVRATRSGSGDVSIVWTRRTRLGGDTWEAAEVPLSEESEGYEIDIVDGATVKRTLSVTSPSALYTSAQQIADFGTLQSALNVRVYQMSPSYGRGSAAQAVL